MITALLLVLAQDASDLERFFDSLRGLGTAQRAFHSVYAAATLGGAFTAPFDGQSIVAEKGARVTVSLASWGFTARSQPGLLVKIPWRPDVRVKRVTYDFRSATFDVDAEMDGFDAFHILGRMAEKRIERTLEREIKSRLPQRLRTPGYSSNDDPDLAGTIAAIRAAFAGGNGVEVNLRDLAAGVTVRAPEDYAVPLSTGWTARVKAGAILGLSAETEGPIDQARLRWMTFDVSPGVAVEPAGDWARFFKSMTVTGVTASGDGRVAARYDLSAERVIDGVQALFALLLVAGGRRPETIHIEPAHLKGARERVDAVMQEELPPRLYAYSHRLFRAYAGPGAGKWLEGVMQAYRPGVASKLEGLAP